MAFYTHVPAAPLSQFIELLWMFENEAPQHARERVLPTGGMQMVIGLHDDLRVYDRQDAEKCDTFGGSLLYGAHTEYVVIGSSSRASLMGVHFRPGGAFPFFRMPAGELQDIIVGLDDLWGAAQTICASSCSRPPPASTGSPYWSGPCCGR